MCLSSLDYFIILLTAFYANKLRYLLGMYRFQFRLTGYPAIFHYPIPDTVPAKLLTDTGYLRFLLLTLSLTVLCNLC